MAPCGSCGGKSRHGIEYEITWADGSKERVATQSEARIKVQASSQRGVFKAVAKSRPI